MADYNTPNVTLARLYECTSKKGNTYMRGRMGFATVLLLKTDDLSDTGQPIWHLKVQEAPAKDGPPKERDRDWQRPAGVPPAA